MASDHRTRERLRRTLAFDFSHEYVLARGQVHLRHDYGRILCNLEPELGELIETTAWGGEGMWCPECAAQVPDYVGWQEPETIYRTGAFADAEELCHYLNIPLRKADELPEETEIESIAAPCGAVLETINPPSIVTLHNDGVLEHVHQYGIVHELTHLLTAPYSWTSEVGCGFYAVQYALASYVRVPYLKRATLEVQGCGDRIFGGILQARAVALGLLDLTLQVPDAIWHEMTTTTKTRFPT